MIGFIGGGNMAEAIINGLLKSSKFRANSIIVSDVSNMRLDILKDKYKIIVTNNNKNILNKADTIILAVKPQIIEIVLNDIKKIINKNEHLIISIAAGVPIKKIENVIGEDKKIIRVMPNACAFALESMSVLSFNKNITESDKQKASLIFNLIGESIELEEHYMDAVTALSGSGPGFIALILEAFSDAGVNIGLPRDIANKLLLQTLKGTLKLLEQKNISFIDLKNMVTSPGGTTIRGIYELEKSGLKSSIMSCLNSAFNRSKELSN